MTIVTHIFGIWSRVQATRQANYDIQMGISDDRKIIADAIDGRSAMRTYLLQLVNH